MTRSPVEDGILELVVSLFNTHLTCAIDSYIDSTTEDGPKFQWVLNRNNALSSIIHSYCAVESLVNEIGHAVFKDSDNVLFLPHDERTFLLRKAVQTWKVSGCLDKICLLTEALSGALPADSMQANFREFNNLRNWIVHGFVFGRTLLLEETSSNNYRQIDREDDTDWNKQFPRLKFNSVDELNFSDARKALEVALEAIILLHKIGDKPLVLMSYSGGSRASFISPPNIDKDAYDIVLKKHLEEIPRQ